jgi:hypothetical protein
MHSTGSRSVGREALWRQKSQTSPKTSLPKFKHQLPSDVWNLDEAKILPQMLDVGQRVRFGRGPRHLASNTDRRARRMFHLQHFLAYTRTFLICDRSLRVLSFGKLFQEPVCQTLTIPENRLQGPYSKGCTLIADVFMPFCFFRYPGLDCKVALLGWPASHDYHQQKSSIPSRKSEFGSCQRD